MDTNLHKSPEGWRRFQDATNQGENARRAVMDHSPQRSAKMAARRAMPLAPWRSPSKKIVASTDAASDLSCQPRMRNRRRVVIGDR